MIRLRATISRLLRRRWLGPLVLVLLVVLLGFAALHDSLDGLTPGEACVALVLIVAAAVGPRMLSPVPVTALHVPAQAPPPRRFAIIPPRPLVAASASSPLRL